MTQEEKKALFAGGCFWCIQEAFDKAPGVLSTTVGYTGGTVKDPTYEQVCAGTTGHVEAIQVRYDSHRVTYRQLLDVFWHNIDPTRNEGQFCDIGPQYRPMIFYSNDQQRKEAEESKEKLLESKTIPKVEVAIVQASTFFPAEEYHQKFYKKSPVRYEIYHHGSGREERLQEIWGP